MSDQANYYSLSDSLSKYEYPLGLAEECKELSQTSRTESSNISFDDEQGILVAHTQISSEERKKRTKSEQIVSCKESKRIKMRRKGVAEVMLDVTINDKIDNAKNSLAESSITAEVVRTKGQNPLKKRKKHLDVLRRNGFQIMSSRHQIVSADEISNATSSFQSNNDDNDNFSKRSNVESSTIDTTFSLRPRESPDLKEIQRFTVKNRTTKISRTIQCHISGQNMSSNIIIGNFPQVLHHVLSGTIVNAEMTASILRWLPDGRKWKVSSWDALQSNIIPRFFPELCNEGDEQQSVCSINAFLWNLQCWNFERVIDDHDTGVYTHKHFVRDTPKLCEEMKYRSVNQMHNESGGDAKLVPANLDVENMNRNSSFVRWQYKDKRKDINVPISSQRNYIYLPKHPHRFYPEYVDFPHLHPYYFKDAYPVWQHSVNETAKQKNDSIHSSSHLESRIISSRETSGDRRIPLHLCKGYNNITPPIRSSRGGGRHSKSIRSRDPVQDFSGSSQHMAIKRSNFPVSQRGRTSRACRALVPILQHLSNQSAPHTSSNLRHMSPTISNHKNVHLNCKN